MTVGVEVSGQLEIWSLPTRLRFAPLRSGNDVYIRLIKKAGIDTLRSTRL
jgi:hypothetical protein